MTMKYSNILVPYDKSDSAKRALETALEFAALNEEASVTLFFAAPVPEFATGEFMAASRMSGSIRLTPEDIDRMQQDYLDFERATLDEDIQAVIAEQGEKLKVVVGQGKPSKAILDFAAEDKSDLIVMGCRGLNAVAGMLGSVSYAVLRNADCPVLIEK